MFSDTVYNFMITLGLHQSIYYLVPVEDGCYNNSNFFLFSVDIILSYLFLIIPINGVTNLAYFFNLAIFNIKCYIAILHSLRIFILYLYT